MDLRRSALLPLVVTALIAAQAPASARAAGDERRDLAAPPAVPERLDRGLVAVPAAGGVHLSWRLLGHEATGATATGLAGPDFAVFRDGRRIATVTGSTTHTDPDPRPGARYQVAPVVRGVPLGRGRPVTAWAAPHHDLPLRRPADGVTPAGESYTYSANDVSVGDVDGDGRYEYVVKWDPGNSKDVSQAGYTGPVHLDTYRLDGTLLHRIDLGVNIRAGAHYTQFLVYDFDGDGRSELMTKTAPGTRTVGGDGRSRYITLPREDVRAGHAHTDDYRLSADGYRTHLIGVFRGWHAHPEVVAGRWPATLEQALGLDPRYAYPLSETDAAALADHFIDVYAPSRSVNNRLRQFAGFVVDGPEYLTVFDGATGRELQTVRYEPGRGDDGLMWGDYAMSRIEPGNRVDRFLSGVAYLDGKRPSAIFARGYYTRSTVAAYDWNGRSLTKRWLADSGHVPMANPFRDTPHGRDGTNPSHAKLTTQGAHSLSVADVDGDGRHEIVYGGATLDDDGSLEYSSTGVLPPGSADPGAVARIGHGDALHVTDVDPDRPGLEIHMVHEGARSAPYGYTLRDARTGEVLYGGYSGMDTGRGMIGDVRPDVRGIETWASMPSGSDSSGLWSADGRRLDTRSPGTNMSIRWAGDLTTQIVNGAQDATPTVDDWRRGTLLTATGTRTNNGTKGTPSLVADVLGDWREELLVRTHDSSALRFHLSTEPTNHKMYTLMHDRQYRVEVARQQTAYNQPPHPGFHLASDTDWSRVPLPPRR
ncbi:rhamnogalacturonan lyase [Lentzea sp. DG1S-22]|uniref:rhamnogalacturonan lyase n=1 Tax=Lentzea sp. DG1S-22 TaxID=3108822 RepID=UPI002E7790CF|nr:rhamnogalacturonan lyase [Lentzea sp. DG1S-22]WVH81582.1 rhamnogalacturonan lyase [Lentzea sp. DG1S-22]